MQRQTIEAAILLKEHEKMQRQTIEAAIIEANRAKNPDRSTTNYDHRTACMDVLIEAARYRIKQKIKIVKGWDICPNCRAIFGNDNNRKQYINLFEIPFCKFCGQALDWGTE